MKTSELIGPALDWAVAKCKGFRTELNYQYTEECRFDGWWQCGPGHWQPLCRYSTDWNLAGPIIEREKIRLVFRDLGTASYWCAEAHEAYQGNQYIDGKGPTPLIAAMRAFVASRLGDEVEIPEELK